MDIFYKRNKNVYSKILLFSLCTTPYIQFILPDKWFEWQTKNVNILFFCKFELYF